MKTCAGEANTAGGNYHLPVYHCLDMAAVAVNRGVGAIVHGKGTPWRAPTTGDWEKTSESGFTGLMDYRDWKNVKAEKCRIGVCLFIHSI